MNKVIITGCVGFIGFHLTRKLLEQGLQITGIDSSYSPISSWPEDSNPVMKRLKNDRLNILKSFKNFKYENISIGDPKIEKYTGPVSIVHLAARAGIPFSKEKPIFFECDNSFNFSRFVHMIRNIDVRNFVYASSSSVYGGAETDEPTQETSPLNPLNIYANTKAYNESQAKIYGELYNIPMTGLRFFTVYGTYGRTDMVFFKWVNAIMKNETLYLNNNGDLYRDFTHVSDIINGIELALRKPQIYKVYNLGRGESVKISDLLSLIEKYTNKIAKVKMLPYPKGEVYKSLSDISLAQKELGYKSNVSIKDGLLEYITWYKSYFNK
jgi:UDP-glucuronate 4-epimerase